jgi:hypothetical protein
LHSHEPAVAEVNQLSPFWCRKLKSKNQCNYKILNKLQKTQSLVGTKADDVYIGIKTFGAKGSIIEVNATVESSMNFKNSISS